MTVVPIITGALEVVPKNPKQRLNKLEITRVEAIQTRAFLKKEC